MSPRRVAEDSGPVLDSLEPAVHDAVTLILDQIAEEFRAEVTAADGELVAAFSVSRIAGMLTRRTEVLLGPLLDVYESGARWLATGMGGRLPPSWTGLRDRYRREGQDALPGPVRTYLAGEREAVAGIADRLGDKARDTLAQGLDAGESPDQLTDRLLALFADDGAQLGDTRAVRVARTEANRTWNRSALDAASVLPADQRPTVKQWLTRRDTRVRTEHADANGQIQLLDAPFTVGGFDMTAPGDPTAPAHLIINCRCEVAFARAQGDLRTQGGGDQTASTIEASNVSEISYPRDRVAAADGSHTAGAMIALIPTQDDAARLAIDGGEPPEQLHCTLAYLGSADDWDHDARTAVVAAVSDAFAQEVPAGDLAAHAFGANHWNPTSDEPSWVWSVGDLPADDRDDGAPTLGDAHQGAALALRMAVDNGHIPEDLVPAQHTPWVAHVCAAYSDAPELLEQLQERTGPVTFDRVRITFAGEATDIPLNPDTEATAAALTAASSLNRTWTTPGETALAFENQQTGDGRIFSPNALYWDQETKPLQYADEMLSGHQGAELAGAITTVGRDGDRITGSGPLYGDRFAGADAITLLDEGAPLGVSVDLDDVDIEFVDRRPPEEGGEEYTEVVLSASLSQASVVQLETGAWMVAATARTAWTASGGGMMRASRRLEWTTGQGGELSTRDMYTALRDAGALTASAGITAAAGDPDDPDGEVVYSESAGEVLMRITRGRLRGATLVSMPAYANARIVLDPVEESEEAPAGEVDASADILQRVIRYVTVSPSPVGARQVAAALGLTVRQARGYLGNAVASGDIVRLAVGQYVGAATAMRTETSPDTPAEGEGEATAAACSCAQAQYPENGDETELEASAWSAMRQLPPLPAGWFREPTVDELPPGSGGVHYADGRVYGWVAQAGEPHAGFPGRNLTIESLGRIDLSHFLRKKFELDDGSSMALGAFTMNVGHHRDSAECETESCQFDDSRTVAAVVTVGVNDRGMWFSGAASPWLSEWDATAFQVCQPSYHMRQAAGGQWQLRAVLSVPVPGHSSPLLVASTVTRSNLALTASAAIAAAAAGDAVLEAAADTTPPAADTPAAPVTENAPVADMDVADAVASLFTQDAFVDRFLDAMDRREKERAAAARKEEIQRLNALLEPARELAASTTPHTPAKTGA